ncbi:DUF58 domain-containing protein [Sandarakinorhabdus sp. DWP1-3-1]|uniref:DUF58 domain-containing protein n=1 Tax=Sandarakinorhabdus sp. DWP1-3-1 TaxID=2804627 RepID=UPI003CF44525
MSPDLIPPAVRNRLKSLRITARRAVDLQGIGLHHSRSRGAGLEFAQYRAYERGDEPRAIDWKLYARSDRFFVRESERESPLALWLLVDASASMAQADPGRPDWSRLAAARGLAAAIAELAMQQGDRFGLIGLSHAGLSLLAAGTGVRQRDRLALELRRLDAGRGFPALGQLAPLWDRVGAHDLVVMISDFFDPATLDLAGRLAAARREVLAIEVLTVTERDFPYRGGYRFRDPETGEELLGDGVALRDDFLARFGAARAERHARLDSLGIRHAALFLDEELDVPLRRLFGSQAAAEYR